MSSTLLIIDIQADNKAEIRQCIQNTFDYMPGWYLAISAVNAPADARFFAFDLTTQCFEWLRTNDSYSDTTDEDEVAIKDMADISHLLEFVFLNTDSLREKPYVPTWPSDTMLSFTKTEAQKKRADEKKKINADKLIEALKEKTKDVVFHTIKASEWTGDDYYGKPSKDWNYAYDASDFKIKADYYSKGIKVGDYSVVGGGYGGKSKYYYKSSGGYYDDDLTEEEFYTYYKNIKDTTMLYHLEDMYKSLSGLHGMYVSKLRYAIKQRVNELELEEKKAEDAKKGKFSSWDAYANAKKYGYSDYISYNKNELKVKIKIASDGGWTVKEYNDSDPKAGLDY